MSGGFGEPWRPDDYEDENARHDRLLEDSTRELKAAREELAELVKTSKGQSEWLETVVNAVVNAIIARLKQEGVLSIKAPDGSPVVIKIEVKIDDKG